ncbi:GGDEF domain-containing protein [Neiella sp. HB171785]|uniref:GGDEF domain-containing protein n=1 Tax=Neiella litorisoli TaxID=2771431 RepID=A0A8J6QS26_9GAMM|nr:GGDEF domain-containing protein [Neiella litorisoli]MBD1390966.1 GGDEF domain-containing protein [Neiella litorisoli]
MSAVANVKKTTWLLFALSIVVMSVITLVILNQSLQQNTHNATQFTRNLILESVNKQPDWQALQRQFPIQSIIVDDIEQEQRLVDYQASDNNSGLSTLLAAIVEPQASEITVHGYQIQLKLDNSQALNQTGITMLLCLLVMIALAATLTKLLPRVANKQLAIDKANLQAALEQISEQQTDVQLADSTSDTLLELNAQLKTINEQVISPLLAKDDEIAALKRHAFHDALSGFGNKNLFKEEMMGLLQQSSVTNYGLLVIVRASALGAINDEAGYAAGDSYIKDLVKVVNTVTAHYQRFSCYRLNTSDLAITFNFEAKAEHTKIAELFTGQLNDLTRKSERDELANVGITDFQSGDEVSELLARCDNALSLAATRSGNSWHFSDSPLNQAEQGKQQWRALIMEVIENSRVSLYGQPQMALNDAASVYTELQARFTDAEGQPISTASLIAQAQSNDLMIQLDKTIIENAINLARDTAPYTDNYAINLSNSSIMDAHFCIWLERHLLRDPAITRRLVFEVSEHGLTSDIAAGRRIIDIIHRVGARFTIEHFGTSILSLKYFRELNPDWVKLDASHTNELQADRKLQYFIRTLVDITHQMGVRVIAEAVETVEQKQLLDNLNIDVIQGYFVGKPEPIEVPSETSVSFE